MRKIKPDGRTYKRARRALAIDFAPQMYPCKKCGYPVVDGYCCTFCGDNNPFKEESDVRDMGHS